MAEVVESPVHVIVELEPPTRSPRELIPLQGPENAREDVATFAKVLTPEKYGMFPTTAAEEVARPEKEKAPVVESYARGKVVESEEEEILLLKMPQSEPARRPRMEAVAVG